MIDDATQYVAQHCRTGTGGDIRIVTERLILRRWRPSDLPAFAALNSDPQVMQWLGSGPMDEAAAQTYVARCETHFDWHDFGFWAVERQEDGQLIGMSGLQHVDFVDHPLQGEIEIGWRQARAIWGQGYASEAAHAVLCDAFLHHGIERLVSYTARTNARSLAVMTRIGMRRAAELDFDHPALPTGHELRPHMVCEIDRRHWMERLATCAHSA